MTLPRQRTLHRACRAPLILGLLGVSAPASAGDLSLLLSPSYRAYSTTQTNAADESTRRGAHELRGRYSATWNRRLYPLLHVHVAAVLQDTRNLLTLGDAPIPGNHRTTTVGGNLRFGPRDLNGSVAFSRAQRSSFQANGRSNAQVNQTASARAELRPAALPRLQLSLLHEHSYDLTREQHDRRTLGASLNARHDVSPVGFRYSISYARPTDEIRQTTTSSVSQRGTLNWSEKLLSGRMRIAAGYRITTTSTRIERAGPQGQLVAQRFPVVGLSGIETFPPEPTDGELSANPTLIDGDTAASANINLGYGPSLEDDTQPREVGVGLAPTSDENINLIYVWTDRWLPAEISGLFVWTAYTSDDNRTWQPMPITEPAVFASFHNRFEIAVRSTRAQYIKLVASPLPATATVEEAYRAIYVTELQVFETASAADYAASNTSAASSATASVSTRLHPREALNHQVGVSIRRRHLPTESTAYSMSNNLSYSRRVDLVTLSGQLTRRDSGDDRRHSSSWTWGASASARPLATLHHSLSYSGQYRPSGEIANRSNQISITNRARVYRGISVLANGGYMRSKSSRGNTGTSRYAAASTSVTPHELVSLRGTYAYSSTLVRQDTVPATRTSSSRASVSASARPLSTLSLSATLTAYQLPNAPDRLLASYGGSFSPLPGGMLNLSATYSESLNLAADGIGRRGAVSLRWTIRPGWTATGSYTYLASISQVVKTHTHAAFAELTGRL